MDKDIYQITHFVTKNSDDMKFFIFIIMVNMQKRRIEIIPYFYQENQEI